LTISADACEDPKSTGVDTIICLDVSDSMKGESFIMAKKAVLKLLNGNITLCTNVNPYFKSTSQDNVN